MDQRALGRWLGLLALMSAVLAARRADAIPAFARKYGLACSSCHESWPRLNDFGQLFRDNGYRLNREKDNPTTQPGWYWPIAFRTTVGFQFQQNTEVPADSGFITSQTGALGFTGLDVLAGGSLGEQVSFLVVLTPGLNSSGFGLDGNDGGDLESAFVGFHRLFGTPYLNLRVGKHAPDLPIDEHRILTLTQGYAMYHFHPQGSAVTFEPGNNQVGLEVYGHSELDHFRYSVSLINENDAPLSKSVISTPVVWAHVQASTLLDSDTLAEIKGGVFGAVGFHPTTFETTTAAPDEPMPIVGTGTDHKMFSRVGAEVHLSFLNIHDPLTVSAAVMFGNEDQALIAEGARDAQFLGWFGEITYTWAPEWTVQARYDGVRTLQTGLDSLPQNEGDLDVVTAMIRHTIELSSRAAGALQLEFSQAYTKTSSVPSSEGTPATTTVLLAVDFAF